jgi:hypothetical protein
VGTNINNKHAVAFIICSCKLLNSSNKISVDEVIITAADSSNNHFIPSKPIGFGYKFQTMVTVQNLTFNFNNLVEEKTGFGFPLQTSEQK